MYLRARSAKNMCHVVQRDSSAIKFDGVEIAFILAFLLAEPLNYTEIEAPDPNCCFTQLQYPDNQPASPVTDHIALDWPLGHQC